MPFNSDGLENIKLRELPQLHSLVFERTWLLDGKDSRKIASAPESRVPEFQPLQKTSALLKAIKSSNVKLLTLTIRGANLKDDDLKYIENGELKNLDLRGNPALTSRGLIPMLAANRIHGLCLDAEQCQKDLVPAIAKTRSLTTLVLTRPKPWNQEEMANLQQDLPNCHDQVRGPSVMDGSSCSALEL